MSGIDITILDVFENTRVITFEDLEAAVQLLKPFGKRIWIAGSVGAVAKAVELYRPTHFTGRLIDAHEALKTWLRDPTTENAARARQKYYPYRQLLNCDDIMDRSNRATSFAVAALGKDDEEAFRLAKIGMVSMAHPLVLDGEYAWEGIEKMIRSLILEK